MKLLKGKQITLHLPNGENRKAQFAIVELDDIIASHNERTFVSSVGYPTTPDGHNINDRNYSGDKNAQAQVIDYARNLQPDRLITTSRTPNGTPIINVDGFVVSGNNRTMSLKLAKQDYPEKYLEYKNFLKEELGAFGFDDSALFIFGENAKQDAASLSKQVNVEYFANPILVRLDYDIPTLNTAELAKYNQSTAKGKRPIDKAMELSNVLRTNPGCRDGMANILAQYERMSDFYANSGDQKRVMDLMIKCSLVTEQQKPEYYTPEAGFSTNGKNFMETVLASIVLGKEALQVSESDGVRSVRQVIVSSLPTLMANQSLTEGSLISDINEAVLLQNEKVRSGLSYANFLSQSNIFATEQKIFSYKSLWLNLLLNRGQRAFKAAIERYTTSVSSNTGISMFETETLAPSEVFDQIIKIEAVKNSDTEKQDVTTIALYADMHGLLPIKEILVIPNLRGTTAIQNDIKDVQKRIRTLLKKGKTEKDVAVKLLRKKEKELQDEYVRMSSVKESDKTPVGNWLLNNGFKEMAGVYVKEFSDKTITFKPKNGSDYYDFILAIKGYEPQKWALRNDTNDLTAIKELYLWWTEKYDTPYLVKLYKLKKATPSVSTLKYPLLDAEGVRRIDKEALDKMEAYLASLPQTKALHIDKNGDYTAERKKLHEKIFKHFAGGNTCIKRGKPLAILTGGAPGSGKSSFIKNNFKWIHNDALYSIDSDEIRAMLPEYEGWNAAITHEETNDILNRLIDYIAPKECHFDILIDGTMTNLKKYRQYIEKLHSIGYDVYCIFMKVAPEISTQRALERYKRAGRYVPRPVIQEINDKGDSVYKELRTLLKGYIEVDGLTGKIIESGGEDLPKDRDYGQLGIVPSVSENIDGFEAGEKSINEGTSNKYRMRLESVANPDFMTDEDGIEDEKSKIIKPFFVPVSSLKEAQTVAGKWMNDNDLGGGNYIDALVYDAHGKFVARISYNRRIWANKNPFDTSKEIILDKNGEPINTDKNLKLKALKAKAIAIKASALKLKYKYLLV